MQALCKPGHTLKVPELLDDPHEKVVSLSTLRTGGLYSHPGNMPGTHFRYRLSRLQAIVRREGLCQ